MDMEKERIKQWVGEVYLQLCAFLSLVEETNFYQEVPEGEPDETPEGFSKRKRMEIKSMINNFSLYPEGQEISNAEGQSAGAAELEKTVDRLKMKLRIILGQTGHFTRQHEVPGVVQRWRSMNPRLNYFDPVYDVIEDDPEAYQLIKEAHEQTKQAVNQSIKAANELAGQYGDDLEMYIEYTPPIHFSHYPDAEMIAKRNAYFAEIKEQNERENRNWSEDRIFQEELLHTIKLLLEADCEGYFSKGDRR